METTKLPQQMGEVFGEAEWIATGEELLYRAQNLAAALDRRIKGAITPPEDAPLRQGNAQPREAH